MENINLLLEAIQLDLKKTEKTIIQKEKRKFNENEMHLSPAWLILFLWWFFYLFWLSIQQQSYISVGIWTALSTLLWAGIWIARARFYSKIEPTVKSQILDLLEIHKELIGTFTITESLDGILEKTELLEKMIRENLWFIKKKNLRIFKDLSTKEVIFCHSILSNLRSDINLRAEEQKATLKQAQIDISKYITWSDSLNKVSELQKSRLNEQIRQFEDLQKVLIQV